MQGFGPRDGEAERLIRIAMEEAEQAARDGNRPFGAVITGERGALLVREHNRVVEARDPTAHAEMNAIRSLCRRLGALTLDGGRLYTNAQPCPMCFAAMVEVRIVDLPFAAASAPGVWPLPIEQLAAGFERHRVRLHGGLLAAEVQAQLRRLGSG